MNPIDRLSAYFSHFPGIGPRQAKRFVYYLLTRNHETLELLARDILELKSSIKSCQMCHHFFASTYNKSSDLCTICADPERDQSIIMIVPRDNDLEQIEKSKAYNGLYFVLGGTLPILDKKPEARIRITELKSRIDRDWATGLQEIILASNLNPEGEHTMEYVEMQLKTITNGSIKITHFGRGFSTGSEIEYADPETIKYALKNRI